MHDGMPYDPIQGQGYECLKATQEESPSVPHRTNFIEPNALTLASNGLQLIKTIY